MIADRAGHLSRLWKHCDSWSFFCVSSVVT